jgi:mercuric reductase
MSRLGSEVTVIQRGLRILSQQPAVVTDELTTCLRAEGLRILTQTQIASVVRRDGHIAAHTTTGDVLRAEALLIATGVRGKTTDMGLDVAGVSVDESGFIIVDDVFATTAEGVYAAGDAAGAPLYVYTAAYEGKLAARNALMGSQTPRDYGALAWVVFTDPQLAGVGMDMAQAGAAGLEAEEAQVPLSLVPRAIAARDTRGMVSMVRERGTHRILGARVLAPEGGELIMAVAMAVAAGMTTDSLTQMLFPYLTLSEALKLTALSFDKNLERFSCCAV